MWTRWPTGTTASRRSPPSAARRDSGRLAQASSVSVPAQPDAPMPPHAAHSDSLGASSSDNRQLQGPSVLMPGPRVAQSPFARMDAPTYRGDLPMPAPAPVSEPAPPIHLANPDPFARARIAAVQSRVSAPTLSEPRPPPPVPPSRRSVMATTGAVSAHAEVSPPSRDSCATSLTSTQGSFVDDSTCALFTAIERVTCTAPACGGLRRVGARVCNRCGQATQARPPQVGDVIMGPLGAPVNGEDANMVDAEVNPTPTLVVDLPVIDLPGEFTQRIRALPSHTMLHVPASCRLRMISVVAQCWKGMAHGRDDYAQLEEGRSKLLLSPVPQGMSAATEVLKRLTLWEEQRFEALLQRAEEQFLLRQRSGKRRNAGGPPDPSARGARARRTAAVGAYRKATTGLVSSMLTFDEREDLRWARSFFRPLNTARLPTVTQTWLPLPHRLRAPGIAPSRACTTPPSPLHAPLALALSTSLTCSTYRSEFMPTKFTRHLLLCSVGFLQGPCLPRPGGSRARGCAGSVRRMASRVPSKWVSSYALPMPSVLSTLLKCICAPRLCRCISGAFIYQGPAKLCVTGAARSNPWCSTALWSRSWPLTWTWSTCLATPSGPLSALPCALISLRPQRGRNGSTRPTLSPHCPLVVSFPPIGVLSKATFLAPSRVPLVLGLLSKGGL